MTTKGEQAQARPHSNHRIASLIALGLVIAVTITSWLLIDDTLALSALPTDRWWFVISVIPISIIALALGMPGSLFSIGSGALFGFTLGTPVALVIAFCAACLTFAAGRGLARSQRCEPDLAPRLGWIRRTTHALGASDWRMVALLRLMPVLPYALINFGLGQCRLRWTSYLAGTALGLIPGTMVHTYLGSVGGRVIGDGTVHPLEWALLTAGLLSVPVLGLVITRRVQRCADSPM
ncbi:MAG: VTT domain-containing protein [Planctomycetota bacterium]|nr:VTT domain-containing protein [Planctomycetota bacterium]